uniref:Minor glycoprotein n=1 Tax=Kibale red colobus virus 1 TaxID=1885929 RepID=F5BD19_9NIDO|nr:minor glycoprotein [Kibale red colobus virus 1]AHH53537.1 minor glycoprotein [Kibale red colobus virus 1]
MPISGPSLLAHCQWHTSSFPLRSILGTCIAASRAWLLLYSCCLCFSLRYAAGVENKTLTVHLPSSDVKFNVTLYKTGCYLLGSVEGGVAANYDTCPTYGSLHKLTNISDTILEPSAFNFALLIATINQTARYPNLYNSSGVTVECKDRSCTIQLFNVSNSTSPECASQHFSPSEDIALQLAQLYLPPALLLALALFLAK